MTLPEASMDPSPYSSGSNAESEEHRRPLFSHFLPAIALIPLLGLEGVDSRNVK